MRKVLLVVLALALCVGLGSLALAGSTTYKGFPVVQVTVNGQPLPGDSPPIIIGGRVYVPLRSVEETLGGAVNWDPKTKTASVTTGTVSPTGTATVTVLGEEATAEAIYNAAIADADAAYDVAARAAYDVFVLANYSSGPGVDHANYVQACLVADAIREAAYAVARAAYLEAGGAFAMAATAETDPRIALEEALQAARKTYDAAVATIRQSETDDLIALGIQFGRPYPLEPIYSDHREAWNAVIATHRQESLAANAIYQQAIEVAEDAYVAAGGTLP